MYVYLRILLLLLYCKRILSEVNLKGGWVRAGGRGGFTRPGPLVLVLGFGLQIKIRNEIL